MWSRGSESWLFLFAGLGRCGRCRYPGTALSRRGSSALYDRGPAHRTFEPDERQCPRPFELNPLCPRGLPVLLGDEEPRDVGDARPVLVFRLGEPAVLKGQELVLDAGEVCFGRP